MDDTSVQDSLDGAAMLALSLDIVVNKSRKMNVFRMKDDPGTYSTGIRGWGDERLIDERLELEVAYISYDNA